MTEKTTPRKLMIIDDHVLFRDGLKGLFRFAPEFEMVGEAGSVREGIEQARLLKPDIILMDFTLPDGTGLDATAVILEENPECKVIFLTVHESDDKLFAAIRVGAKGFLPKNIEGSTLISSLQSLDRDEVAFSRKMMTRIVEEFSRTETSTAINQGVFSRLTLRELDVLCELQTGATNHEIAQQLFLSENTIKHHVQNIIEKLGVENRRQAGQMAQRAGLQSKSPNQK